MANLKLKIIRNAPTILTVSGIILNFISIYTAIKGTQKIERASLPLKEKIVREHNKLVDLKTDKNSDPEDIAVIEEAYREDKKELTKRYVKTYLPCLVISALSTAAIVSSHNISKARNVALAGTLTTLQASLNGYRERVKAAVGEDKEHALFNNLEVKTIKNKDGKKEEVLMKSDKTEETVNSNPYEVFYGPGNLGFDKQFNGLNMTMLLQHEQYFNQKLTARGYVFLYEVYEALGFTADMLGEKKLQAAHVVGWVYDRKNPIADNYISFGLHDKHGVLTPEAKRFQLGYEEFIILDFNVQGDILTGDHGHPTFMTAAVAKGA